MIPEPTATGGHHAELATALALGHARHRGRPWPSPARSLLTEVASSPTRNPIARRVLCADRHEPAAAALAAALRLAGFDARACRDGAAALVAVTDFRPHACVFDLETAGVGGCELAQWVRSELGGLVFLIGSADRVGDELDQTASVAGFDLLLARPADTILVTGLLARPAAPE